MVADLHAHDLVEQARYFYIHQRRMQHHEFRGEAYPIGSGTVESGIKQFKHRLTAAGIAGHAPALNTSLPYYPAHRYPV